VLGLEFAVSGFGLILSLRSANSDWGLILDLRLVDPLILGALGSKFSGLGLASGAEGLKLVVLSIACLRDG